MRVAILCPGPSLPKTWDGTDRALTIAVNKAALFCSPDWFCAGDPHTFQAYKIRPRVGICGSDYAINLMGDELPRDVRRVRWSALQLPNMTSECNYSAVAATALAAHIGATSIYMHGADMCGMSDYTGIDGPSRDTVRWDKERKELQSVIQYIQRLGITFERIL